MGLKDCFELKVDFMDMNTMNVYHIQEYFQSKADLEKQGISTEDLKVTVTCNGELIGYWDPNK